MHLRTGAKERVAALFYLRPVAGLRLNLAGNSVAGLKEVVEAGQVNSMKATGTQRPEEQRAAAVDSLGTQTTLYRSAMSFVIPGLTVNPFDKDIVHQPRDNPPSVESLNQEYWIGCWVHLLSPDSGPIGERQTELVLSPAPGYGKSHLIGRLFEALSERAYSCLHPTLRNHFDLRKSILFSQLMSWIKQPIRATVAGQPLN